MNKFEMKGKISYPKKQSAFLSSRSDVEKGSVSYTDHPDAYLAKRGEPEKGKVTYSESRYK